MGQVMSCIMGSVLSCIMGHGGGDVEVAGGGGDVEVAEVAGGGDVLHSSRPTAPHARNYDVFLNHRGPDVKKSFVDHLCASLETAGIQCFVDYKQLKVGEKSWGNIVSAIQHSKIHIAIFSPGYVDSSWCLDELLEIQECRDNGSSNLFLPVFYKVAPGDLRSLTSDSHSCYFSAFASLRHRYNTDLDRVQKWKMALHEASMISGWTLNDAANGFEARLVKLIVSEVLNVLNRTLLDVAKHPVGVNEILQKALNLMEIDKVKKGVHTFGIFGMGGAGKTTLAKSIYNGIYREFECYSFMQSVRSEAKTTGLRGVQERMIRALLKDETISVASTSLGKQIMKERLSGMKVLIVLDDVDAREQLDELLPPLESCRLRNGSQIVITTRDEQIVIWANAQHRFSVQGLDRPQAHQLFSWHAFLRNQEPSEDFKRLATKVVDACKGLPLALEVLGSHLYTKEILFWESTVKVLEGQRRSLPPAQREVTSILRISYDGLSSEEERSMFLDIACCLLGEHEARARRIWRKSDAAELCLETLKLKCLVKLDQDGRLTIHDLLRDMGREIVERKHANLWQRSHLWNKDDVCFVLEKRKGTSYVRAVCLAMTDQEIWDTTAFGGMDALRLLALSNGNITGDFGLFSKELRWFQWRNCPLESLPLELLAFSGIAVLDLMGSKISSLLPGHMLKGLLELNLSKCSNLKELPEFSDGLNTLEMIDLGSCVNLESLPESIGCLSSSLTHLNLSECQKLTTLPDAVVRLHSLKLLFLNKCTSLTRLPDAIGKLHALQEVGLEGVSLELLPESFGDLSNLSSLNLSACSRLRKLPSTIGKLRKLTSFGISQCPLIQEIPQGVSSLTNLVNLEATICKSLSKLPDNLENLSKLVTLSFHNSSKLCCLPSNMGQLKELITLDLGRCAVGDGGLPIDISTLSSLRTLLLHYNAFSMLPGDLHLLPKLQRLQLDHCLQLREIPHLPPSLTFLDIGDCPALTRLSCLSSLRSLSNLVLCNCAGLVELTGLDCLLHLKDLNITGCKGIVHLPQPTNLTSLEFLHLAGSGVSLLQDDVPWISKLDSLEHVSIYGEKLPECLSSCSRDFQKVVNKQHADDCLIEVKVPEGGRACKGVVCCFVSHDQGWSDYPWDHGRYWSTYTGVQAQVMVGEDDSKVLTQQLLLNRHADSRNQLHISIFREAHPFVANVKGGNTIRIVATSVFRGWAITVNEGAIKLIYEDSEMEQILEEMSRQAKSIENVQAPGILRFRPPSLPPAHQDPVSLELTHWSGILRFRPRSLPPARQDPVSLELTHWSVNRGLPEAYTTLQSLQTINIQSIPISRLPSNFHLLTNLQSLELRSCGHLCEISSLPPKLVGLDLGNSPNLQAILCLSSLQELRDLVLCDCSGLVELAGLDCLVHLSQLNITGCTRLMSLPHELEKLTSLKGLYMAGSGVSLLQDNEPWIQKLPSLELISVYGEEVPGCLLNKVQVEGVIAKQHADVCCMELAVPEVDAAAYKAALFCFVSHDQGFSDYKQDHGRYRNSHTSMHAEIIESEAESPKFSQVLFVNRHADKRSQLHISIFRASHPFVAGLKSGDKICVLAKSVYPGWAITVREGAGKVMSGENELDETLRALSRGFS